MERLSSTFWDQFYFKFCKGQIVFFFFFFFGKIGWLGKKILSVILLLD